mmetsp:Transcript_19179/g.53692  ORF Transcript_19179/g.53692 Transcript_19179/m.53692 type:complete len:286 (-) Transcript_19179:335-1192(-)
MIHRHNRCLSHCWVRLESVLHLSSANPVTTDIDHIIYAAYDPIISFSIPSGTISCEVHARVHLEVRLLKACMVPRDRTHHAGPWLRDDQMSLTLTLQHIAFLIHDGGGDAEERQCSRPRLLLHCTRQRRDHVGPCLRLPPGVHDGASAPSHNIFVPAVCIRVDGLAHRPKQPQARPAVPGHPFISLCMQRTHSGGCSVEDRHLVLIHNLPAAAWVRVSGHTLKDDLGGHIQHGAIGQVGVPCDPPAVGCAPIHIAGLVVKHILEGQSSSHEVAPCCMQHTLWLPC